ncbi:hypothetical protein PC116_g3586 [Phytophthora cactorum]|uniref:Uncharacterized protein n=1 Tax=Phytophthora cactorum TaxID=29920 RepID=A0A8T1CSF6_9STRA|nr:hypothetical protein Pcac1_g13659 [Phytophthora cactorum]KAG2846045.1 hypothetical protein PC112_g1596 [Phytophthora cactorum]KAG2926990.1 hypothetical protein PC115_g7705 [Phytophthora cactorum]KAG3038692.1 hypothetical protein PC119_g2707 [Phytophthora cactorum]KAG3059019.1 hypothetical protein PC121_g14121 [Phytophthora cactorum]
MGTVAMLSRSLAGLAVLRVLWAAKAVATPTKTDEEALVMAVDEASVVALYVAVAGVVMTMHELLTQ